MLTSRRDEKNTSTSTIKVEGTVEVHNPMLGPLVEWRVLDFRPLDDEVSQSLRFDGGARGELDRQGPKLYRPFDDSAIGIPVVEDVAEWKGIDHLDRVRLEVMS